MGLLILIAGLALFLGAHSFVTFRAARAAAIERFGKFYWLMFALTSAAGVILIAWGFALYRQTGWIDVWSPPRFMRHVTVALMLPATILIVAAYLPGHIKRWARHPMIGAIKTWALAHLLSNGDLGSILLFGSFLVWAIYARIAIKQREQAGEVTNIQQTDSGWTNDAVAVVIGVFVYLALGFSFHPVVIGVPVFGG